MSNSLQPHRLQHARLPCPSLFPKLCSNSCSLSWWCHPTISSSATLFSFCLQSFPASGHFSTSWLFTSGGQSIWASASASVCTKNIQGWSPLGLTGLIFFLSRDSQESSPVPQVKSINSLALSLMVQLSHPYMITGKTIALTIQTFASKVTSLLLNTLSGFIIVLLSRSKDLLISWLQLPSLVILEPKKIKSVTVSICHEAMKSDAKILAYRC